MSQALEALEKGNRKRLERAKLKRRVEIGEIPVSAVIMVAPEILRSGPWSKKTITVADILTWQPHWGEARAEKKLRRLGIDPFCELHELPHYRRKSLARLLR